MWGYIYKNIIINIIINIYIFIKIYIYRHRYRHGYKSNIYTDTNTYINVCTCVIHMGSTTGVVKDVCYRAKEGTKIHLIYPLK